MRPSTCTTAPPGRGSGAPGRALPAHRSRRRKPRPRSSCSPAWDARSRLPPASTACHRRRRPPPSAALHRVSSLVAPAQERRPTDRSMVMAPARRLRRGCDGALRRRRATAAAAARANISPRRPSRARTSCAARRPFHGTTTARRISRSAVDAPPTGTAAQPGVAPARRAGPRRGRRQTSGEHHARDARRLSSTSSTSSVGGAKVAQRRHRRGDGRAQRRSAPTRSRRAPYADAPAERARVKRPTTRAAAPTPRFSGAPCRCNATCGAQPRSRSFSRLRAHTRPSHHRVEDVVAIGGGGAR